MKLMTFNVRLWTRDKKKSDKHYWKSRMTAMKRMIEDQNPDIICFQEMIFPTPLYIPKGYKRVGLSFHHHIYVKKEIKYRWWFYAMRYQFADIIDKKEGNKFRLFCLHGRWEKEKQDKLIKGLRRFAKSPSIMAGDWNMVYDDLHKYYDWKGLGNSARKTLNLPEDYTVDDYDWEHKIEIDQFYLTGGIIPKSYKVIYDGYGVDRISDHYPVVIEI